MTYKAIGSTHPFWRAVTALADRVDCLLGFCRKVLFSLSNVLLGVLLTINMANIVTRELFGTPIEWVYSWSVVLFVWSVFLTLFVIYRARKDITVEFFIDWLGKRWRLAPLMSRVLVDVSTLILSAVIIWQAPQILSAQVGDIEIVGIPRYTESIPLFISCGLIFINFIVDAVFIFDGRETPNHGSKIE